MTDFKKQGKANRAAGVRFEDKVYNDLEKKEWIVSRWMKNVQLETCKTYKGKMINLFNGVHKLIPSKPSIRMIPGKGPILVSTWTGFPDFITYKNIDISGLVTNDGEFIDIYVYEVIGVEAKSNGYLTLEEKEKCEWLLKNKIFSKIIIASKGEKRGEIVYKDIKEILLKGGRKKENVRISNKE